MLPKAIVIVVCREYLSQQSQGVDVYMRPAEQQVADVLIDQIHESVVARDGVDQWGRGVHIGDALGRKDELRLFENVVDVHRHLGDGPSCGELLHPARVHVDPVKSRPQSPRNLT